MSVYNVRMFNSAGALVLERNAHGSCTGCFQMGGSFIHPDAVRYEVQLSAKPGHSAGFLAAICKSKLLQGLVPGMEFMEKTASTLAYYNFPNIDEISAERTVTALRILKCLGHGAYYDDAFKRLREYELTPDELIVLACFGGAQYAPLQLNSDNMPLLSWRTKAHAIQNQGNIKYDLACDQGKRLPRAGMLLPLIRGEVKAGFQWPIIKGYFKEGAFASNIYGQDSYGSMECYNNAAPEDCLTANNPIIWHEAEHQDGPIIEGTNFEAVVEWVLQKLGK